MIRALTIALALALSSVALAADPPLQGPLAPLAFMVGDWRGVGEGTGPGAGGDSAIHPDLGGRLLVRRDHVLTKAGGAFDSYMVTYADGAALKAEFVDTEGHVIHYAVAPGPGPSAVFLSPPTAQAPGFRLTYAAASSDRLHIRFEIAPPGGGFRIYTEGDVTRR